MRRTDALLKIGGEVSGHCLTFNVPGRLEPLLTTVQNFWAKVDKHGPVLEHMDSRCWVWTGCTDKGGYGKFTAAGKTYRAHRFSFMLATGEEPEVVCHKCDNPACVRPNHLYAGNKVTNLLDVVRRHYRDQAA